MKLKLHEISEVLELSFTEKEGWLRDVMTRLRLHYKGGISLQLRIEKQKETIFVQGHWMATLLFPCSRCVRDIQYKIDEYFSPVLVQGKEPYLEEGTLHKEALDVAYFQGDEIDLSEILHEQVILGLPIKPLCDEKCKGLCPQCGQDLNVEQCHCEKGFTTSAFGVLKKLKIKKQ